MDSNPNRFILSKLPTNERIRFYDYEKIESHSSKHSLWMRVVFRSQHKSLLTLETNVWGHISHSLTSSLANYPKMDGQLILMDFNVFDWLCFNYSRLVMEKADGVSTTIWCEFFLKLKNTRPVNLYRLPFNFHTFEIMWMISLFKRFIFVFVWNRYVLNEYNWTKSIEATTRRLI